MAKLQDKFFNRVIEGDLEVSGEDKIAPEAVASAIAGGDVDNAKPIYCHPIYCQLVRDATLVFTFTCLIFNNDPTPFTGATFFQWCENLFEEYSNASVMASGFIGNDKIVSRLCKDSRQDFIGVECSYTATESIVYGITREQVTGSTFTDGVNKIN